MEDWLGLVVLFVAGYAAGVINVIAGGGSFLTLPILIFLGLPASVANGTNRVGILTQSIGAVWGFHRHKVLRWKLALPATVPAAVGAVLGTWGALLIGDTAFKRVLAILMIVMSLWTLWDPFAGREMRDDHPAKTMAISVGFFLVGIYGGFVQAGVGFLILATTTLAGLDLVRGNALKVLSVLAFTIVSLAMFWWEGKIDWVAGLILAVSSTLGAFLGVRLTVLKGHVWVKRFVTAMIIIFAIQLLLGG